MDNPWFRVERRGFQSVVHPTDLDGKLRSEDLELIAWYPDLNGRDEGRVHKHFALGRVGEFHTACSLDHILSFCDAMGARAIVSPSSRIAAQRWAGKLPQSQTECAREV